MNKEQEYIVKTLDGDTASYRHLVERYQTGLIIYCEQLVHDREEAEDIAQETFIKAYEKLAEFDPEKARFSTWLYRIASNKAIDHLRRSKRKVDVSHIEEMADVASQPNLHEDEILAIRTAVDELEPPIISEIIKAYYWQGKSYQAIAEEFGLPINTVGTWIRKGKAQLKEVLA
jgi:RNA polymerase sigma-70 factor (ECF subfamily)